MLKARQKGASRLRIEKVLDLDDGRNGLLCIAKELEADGPRMRGHAVQDPVTAGDQSVAAFLLDPGKATQHLVGDVLS